MEFKDHFSKNPKGYAAHRPVYPPELVDYLASLCAQHELAWDVGCGSGQLAVPLKRRFARVIAEDASAGQIASADAREGVEYRVAPAERSTLESGVADLITVAQAAHWLNLPAFYAEARRVAREPGAVLALITYGALKIPANPEAERVVTRFHYETVGRYWPAERELVEARYRTLEFPFEEITAVPEMALRAEWNCAEVAGYVGTWSAVKEAEQAVGAGLYAAFREELAMAWGNDEKVLEVRWPLALRVGRI